MSVLSLPDPTALPRLLYSSLMILVAPKSVNAEAVWCKVGVDRGCWPSLALDRYPAMNEPQDHVSQSIDAD